MKLPLVNCRYGAPMGRPSRPNPYLDAPVDASAPHTLHLQRVPLEDGYDEGGAYWGCGAPLYWYVSDDGTIEGFLRARHRDDAKAKIRKDYPAATFNR